MKKIIYWLIDNDKYIKWPIIFIVVVIALFALIHAFEISHKPYMK